MGIYENFRKLPLIIKKKYYYSYQKSMFALDGKYIIPIKIFLKLTSKDVDYQIKLCSK